MKCAIVVIMSLASVSAMAQAQKWYRPSQECTLSDVAPAQVYERNEVYGGASIIDQGGDRVDVIAQGMRLIFFRTAESCNAFLGEQLRALHEMQQDRENALQKYR